MRLFSSTRADRNGFQLPEYFLEMYQPSVRQPSFGFNGLGEIAYLRTYARYQEHLGRQERWHETIERVVTGCFNMQKEHFAANNLKWHEEVKQTEAMRMFDKMFNMKFLPPGRGLWAMGTPITEQKKLYAALNNCAFVSTGASTVEEFIQAFEFMMDSSMLGIGTGFDTNGKQKWRVHSPDSSRVNKVVVADTREGWVKSTSLLLSSYLSEG